MRNGQFLSLRLCAFSLILPVAGLVGHLFLTACKSKKTTSSSTREVPYKENAGKTKKGGYSLNPADTSCGGYPTLRIETMPGSCVGMVKHSEDEKFQPRVMLEIPGRVGHFLITDFAAWDPKDGKIWLVSQL